jgi:hypothetical protein
MRLSFRTDPITSYHLYCWIVNINHTVFYRVPLFRTVENFVENWWNLIWMLIIPVISTLVAEHEVLTSLILQPVIDHDLKTIPCIFHLLTIYYRDTVLMLSILLLSLPSHLFFQDLSPPKFNMHFLSPLLFIYMFLVIKRSLFSNSDCIPSNERICDWLTGKDVDESGCGVI